MKKFIKAIPAINSEKATTKGKISFSSLRPSGKKANVTSSQSACGNVCG